MQRNRYFLIVLTLLAAILACDLPASLGDIAYELPTKTPTTTPAPTAILFVSKTGNDSHDCATLVTACLSIMGAVNKAPSGALINVGPGTYQELGPVADEGMIIRDTNLWVHGSGTASAPTTIISGGTGRDALIVTGTAHAVIENVSLSGGGTSHGGIGDGLRVTGSANVTLRDSIVQGNSSAGINTLQNVTVILENVTVSANNGGGILNPQGTLTVRASRIINNLGQPAVYSGGHVTISDTTISGNHSTVPGTAIFNEAGGMLMLERSTISGNHITGGGSDFAIYNYTGAQMTVVDSTISGNSGNGIQSFGNLAIVYSTIARNGGAGLFANTLRSESVRLHIENSIFEENDHQDCSYQTGAGITFELVGRIISDGSCVFITGGPFVPAGPRTTDRFLGPLANNGGATMTHALLAGSAAIDAASGPCIVSDQRGVGRPVGSACDVGAYEYGASPAAEVYATPEPTATNSSIPDENKPTPTLGIIYLPTAAATSGPSLVTLLSNANCRKGPGTAYDPLTAFKKGVSLQALARNDQNTWVQVSMPTGGMCWVAVSTLETPGAPNGLPILQAPPLPDTPGAFADKASCVIKLKKLSVKLSWSDVSGETGYHLYRNGTLLETLGANTSIYVDGSAPLGKDLLYELEAFNVNGSSARVQTTVGACK